MWYAILIFVVVLVCYVVYNIKSILKEPPKWIINRPLK
jgi:hypothetical protein